MNFFMVKRCSKFSLFCFLVALVGVKGHCDRVHTQNNTPPHPIQNEILENYEQ